MSANLPPLPAGPESNLPVPSGGHAIQPYEQQGYTPPGAEGGDGNAELSRLLAPFIRYRWLIAFMTVVGLVGGVAATRIIDPTYEVNGTVFATPTGPGTLERNPVSPGTLTQMNGWRDLIKSYAITDPVVQQLALYLKPDKASDSLILAGFSLKQTGPGFRPGEYTFKADKGRYTLTDKLGLVTESGTVGDSVGRTAGFAWVPSARLIGTKPRTVKFTVVTPREASRDILSRFDVVVTTTSPVMSLTLRGTATDKPAATLNAMLTRFIDVASELKKRELVQQTTTLGEQLEAAQNRLQSSEHALQDYRVNTISQPSETPALLVPGPGGDRGLEVSQPVFGGYFQKKTEVDMLRRDRTTLEQFAASLKQPNSTTPPEVVLSVPTLVHDEAGISLKQAISSFIAETDNLRKDLQLFKDSAYVIKDRRRVIDELRSTIIPQRLSEYIDNLRTREQELNRQLADATKELQQIPQRTIQQGALERERNVQADIYTSLRNAYAKASLAQESAVPDVKVLDSASTPSQPSGNTAVRLIGAGIVAGLALGLLIAFVLDKMDHRFRSPDQAKEVLGLDVLGAVPVVDQSGRQSPEAVAQIVEAFRSIRMNVRYASAGQRTIMVGITSPGPGDGKSLIASNLALSFAEGGWRTVLVDGDTRRGQLHVTFDAQSTPGLVEYLEGTSLLGDVLYSTHHDNLTLISCGTRHRRAPELLATPRMQDLLAALSAEFDVVIIDTPPLGAGTDAYAVGTACGQLAVVLRHNKTDLKMAKAKLGVLAGLPVTLVGAILNEVRTDSGAYQYYSYDPDYVLAEETPALTAGTGTALTVSRDVG
jgi:capsular exopolysaccharide synthesis family protein